MTHSPEHNYEIHRNFFQKLRSTKVLKSKKKRINRISKSPRVEHRHIMHVRLRTFFPMSHTTYSFSFSTLDVSMLAYYSIYSLLHYVVCKPTLAALDIKVDVPLYIPILIAILLSIIDTPRERVITRRTLSENLPELEVNLFWIDVVAASYSPELG